MHISVWKFIIHTVYILYVSATYVAIIRQVHYKHIYIEILQKLIEPMHRYKVLNLKKLRFKIKGL